MRYALLVYNDAEAHERRSEAERERVRSEIFEILERPEVTGWLRLQAAGSATTLRDEAGRALLTDGPFVDSKDYLGGLIVIEADDLDGALAVAEELQRPRGSGSIEIRAAPRARARCLLSEESAGPGPGTRSPRRPDRLFGRYIEIAS